MNIINFPARVEVVIATRDRPLLLDQAINSLRFSASFCPSVNINILVSDNSESDSTQHLCALYHPDVGYRRFGPVDAFTHFSNIFSSYNSQYLMVMHDDDRVLSNFFVDTLSILTEFPHLAAVAANAIVVNSLLGVIKMETFSQVDNVVIDGPAQLLSHYFGNEGYHVSPWPSYIYNMNIVKNIPFRRSGGKYSDLIFLCEVAERGQIRWARHPQYVYRDHPDNDSKGYNFIEQKKLYYYLFNRYQPSASDDFLRILREELEAHSKSKLSRNHCTTHVDVIKGLIVRTSKRLCKFFG